MGEYVLKLDEPFPDEDCQKNNIHSITLIRLFPDGKLKVFTPLGVGGTLGSDVTLHLVGVLVIV